VTTDHPNEPTGNVIAQPDYPIYNSAPYTQGTERRNNHSLVFYFLLRIAMLIMHNQLMAATPSKVESTVGIMSQLQKDALAEQCDIFFGSAECYDDATGDQNMTIWAAAKQCLDTSGEMV
jgi:hypothetical protein